MRGIAKIVQPVFIAAILIVAPFGVHLASADVVAVNGGVDTAQQMCYSCSSPTSKAVQTVTDLGSQLAGVVGSVYIQYSSSIAQEVEVIIDDLTTSTLYSATTTANPGTGGLTIRYAATTSLIFGHHYQISFNTNTPGANTDPIAFYGSAASSSYDTYCQFNAGLVPCQYIKAQYFQIQSEQFDQAAYDPSKVPQNRVMLPCSITQLGNCVQNWFFPSPQELDKLKSYTSASGTIFAFPGDIKNLFETAFATTTTTSTISVNLAIFSSSTATSVPILSPSIIQHTIGMPMWDFIQLALAASMWLIFIGFTYHQVTNIV